MTDRIRIETKGIDDLADQLVKTPKRSERITRMAGNTAIRQARTKVRRILSAKSGLTQKFFKSRIRADFIERGVQKFGGGARDASLWIGLNAIPATKRIWGRLRQDAYGSWAKKHFLSGAFVATMPRTGHTAIWRRIGRKRLPIEREAIQIDFPDVRAKLDVVAAEARAKYASEIVRLARVDWSKVKSR